MNKNQKVTKKSQSHVMALNVIGAAVASCFGATAMAAGTGGQFVNGTGSITTQGNLQTIINSPNSIINWNTFSSSTNETIKFIQQNASSAVLNRVIGADPSILLGTLSSNGRVFVINPNGILFGATSVVNVNGLVASTLDISNADFIAGKLNFIDGGNAGSVVNQGVITTRQGGSVYLIAPDVTNSGIISSPKGDAVLAAGHSVQLVDSATPELSVLVTAGGSAVNVGQIVAHSGDIGIYGALITQGGKLDADAAVGGEGGTIIVSASQDIDMLAGGVTTASGGAGSANAGEIKIIADGSLNVAQGHEIHVDGGLKGGDGGFLEVSGKHGIVLQGEMTGVAVAGYKGGSLLIDPSNIVIDAAGPDTFTNVGPFINATAGSGTLTIDPAAFKTWADAAGWDTVALTATNDITVDTAIGAAASRFNHNLNLTAGHDLDVNADIYLGITRTLKANAVNNLTIAPLSTTSVTVDAGAIKLTAGSNITIGGAAAQAKTNLVAATNINATAGSDVLIRAGNVSAVAGDSIDTTVSLTAGGDITLTGLDVSVSAGSARASALGGGAVAHAATAVADVNLKAGGNVTINAKQDVNIFAHGASANASNSHSAGAAANTAKADSSITITAGKLFTVNAGDASDTGQVYIETQGAVANATKNAGAGSAAVVASGAQTATATANLTITAGTGIAISARDSNTTGTGTGTSFVANTTLAHVGVGAFGVTAMAAMNGAHSGDKLSGNNAATATASTILKTTSGDIALSATGGYNGGSVFVVEGNGYAGATQNATGGGESLAGNNTATAQLTVGLAAAGDLSLLGDKVRIVAGPNTAAIASQTTTTGAGDVLTGAQSATLTDALSLTAGGNVTLAATNGDVMIGAVSGSTNSAYARASQTLNSGNISTTGNVAKLDKSITIKAGGDLNITGSNVGIFGSFASANASQFVYQTGGGKLTGNQTATASDTITLTAGGSIALTATNGDVSIYANHAIGHFGTSATNSPNITRALAQQGGTSNGSNVLTGNLAATATGGVTLTAGKDVNIQADNVNIYNNAASASALRRLSNAGSDTLTGALAATASSNINITGGGNISIRASSTGDVNIGNHYSYTYYHGSGTSFNTSDAYGASATAGQSTANNTGISTLSGNQTANATTGIALKAGTAGSINIQGGNVSIQGADADASAFNYISGATHTATGNNVANATNAVSLTAGKDINISATNTNSSGTGRLSILANGSADASAYNYANGASKVTGNNTATANNGITLTAGGSVGLTANSDVALEVDNRASADAYNSAGGNGNTVNGVNTAKANNALSITATTGAITVAATGGSGSVYIYGETGEAFAYNTVSGNLNKVTGNQSASANNAIKLTAGTNISVTANQNVSISAYSATGSAYNAVTGASNTVTGNNAADGRSTVDLLAKGAITLTAVNSSVNISASESASAQAYNRISGPNDKNTVTGNHSANALDSVTLTGSSIAISGVGVNISTGTGAEASAYNTIRNVISGSVHASSNKIAGINKAVANNTVALTATGAISIDAKTGDAYLSINDYGSASAYNSIQGGFKNGIVGGNTATGTTSINIKAGTTLSVSGKNVYAYVYDGSGTAYNYIGGGGSASKPNTISGNNTATGTTNINLAAGGAVNLTATGGSVSISANGGSPDAYAYNAAYGTKNVITGNNTVIGSNGIKITGTSVTLSATDSVYLYGTHARAEAYNIVGGSSNVVTGNNNALSETKIDVIATAGNLTINGGSGSVYVSNEDYAYGLAYNAASGTKNKITGANTATGNNAINLSATGLVTIKGDNGVYIYANSASASGYNTVTGASNVVTGNNVATANNTLTIKGGAGVNISAASASVYISAVESASAYAYNYAGGTKGTVTGNNSATALVGITLTGPSIAVNGGNGVYIYGDSAYGSAYNRAGGSSNVVTGNNKATGGINIALNATAGNLQIEAAGGSHASVYVSASSYAYANAYNAAGGTKNKVTGANTAAGTVALSLNATGSVTIKGEDGVYLYADQASGSAYNIATGNSHMVAGNNIAVANNTLTVKGGTGINISAASNSVYISANGSATAHAYNYAGGNKDTITGNHVASGTTAITLTAPAITVNAENGINIYGDSATAAAYNYVSGNSNNIVGANKATANVNVALTATGNIALDGHNNKVYISGSESGTASAYNYVSGNKNKITGANTAVAGDNLSLTAGGAIAITGTDVVIRTYGGSATASNYVTGSSNIVTGAHTATFTGNTILKAGGAVTLTATTGNVSIEAYENAEGFASNSVYGDKNTVTGNQTASATTNLSITGASITINAADTIQISGSYAEGTARNYIGGGASSNIVTGNNKATGINAITLAATGDVSLTAGTGDVNISADDYTSAAAYNIVHGNLNKVTGTHVANANDSISITAGGALSVAAGGNVFVSASGAYAYAYNTAYNDSNTIVGNNTATAGGSVNLKAGKAVTITAGSDITFSNTGNYASPHAENHIYGGKGNTITGNNTATATGTLGVTGSVINLTAGNDITLYDYYSEATASNYASGGSALKANKITGNNTANASTLISFVTPGNLTMAAGGDLDISGSYASAGASNYATGINNKIVGNNVANTTMGITLSAGGAIALSGANVYIAAPGAYETTASNYIGGGSGNAITGNNTATNNGFINIKAVGSVTISATGGDATLSQYYSPSAYAKNKINSGIGQTITGNNTANANSTVSISGASIAVSATGDINIYGTTASASAYNYANAGSASKPNVITGANNASATASISLTATGAVSLTAGGNVDISAADGAEASAYNSGAGNTKITGNNVANATNTLVIKAGTDLTVTANSGSVTIDNNTSGSGTAYNAAYGNKNTITGNNTANGTASISLTAGGNLTLAGGQVNVSNNDSPDANAYNYVSGDSNAVTGNHSVKGISSIAITAGKVLTITADNGHAFSTWTAGDETVYIGNTGEAEAYGYNYASGNLNKVTGVQNAQTSNLVTLTAGTGVSVSAVGDVTVNNGSAEGGAYNTVSGNSNVVTGAHVATATQTISIKTTTGNISMTAASGNVSLNASSGAQAEGYNVASGNKNVVTGNQTATANNGITLATGGGGITLNGDNVYVYGASATASAYNSANGSLDKVTGNNTAKAGNGVTLTATQDISLKGDKTTGSVYISGSGDAGAYAYNKAAGGNSALTATTVTGNNTATGNNNISFTTAGNINVTAHTVQLHGASATASAYNTQLGSFNKIAGNNTANAAASINFTAGKALNMAATGAGLTISDNTISGTKSASAYAYDANGNGGIKNATTGNNAATASNSINLKAGTGVTLSGQDVKISGAYAYASAGQYVTGPGSHSATAGSSNNIAGTNTATAGNAITITAGTGGIAITAVNNVDIKNHTDAYASASHHVGNNWNSGSSSGINTGIKNSINGVNTAKASNTITLTTTGDITIAGKNVTISGSEATAYASNRVLGSGTGNVFVGANNATATTSIALNATGNINVLATNKLTIDANSGGYAYAVQQASGSGNTLGANNATAADTINLKAGKAITLSGDTGVYIAADGGTASALATSGNTNTRGANIALADGSVNVTAGTSLTVAADSGDVSIYTAAGNNNYANAAGAGVNTATYNGKVNLTATGAVDISGNNVFILGGYDKTSADANGSNATAVNTATANGDVNITGASVTVAADGGNVSIYNSSGASAYATGNGKNTANASANINLTASGALSIFSNGGDIFVAAGQYYGNNHSASASATLAADTATATANSNVNLKGATVTIATTGNLTLGNIAVNSTNSSSVAVTRANTAGLGTTKATSTADVKVQAGVLNLGADNVYIQGGSASMSGATAKAEASTLVYANSGAISTITGDLDVTAGGGYYSVAGIASVGALTLNIANDVNVTGGAGLPFQVVNGTYVRNESVSGYYYGTATTPTTSPTVSGKVLPGAGSYTAFGINGTYTTSGQLIDPVAFIQIK